MDINDKQKQIEEMELVMQNSCGCRYSNTTDMILNNDRFFNREATALYNADYRKVPKGSVVLTREEQMARDYEYYNLGYEACKQESQKREDYLKTLEYHINDLERALIVARKQAVKEFEERLKAYIDQNEVQTTYFGNKCFIDKEKIDEIAKEFGVEIEE